ncbi:MAG: hypothetical protein MUF08_08195 [Burkholderiaceae bacterium]|jgi:hypothetical protein|nr:hypothetical protein [Burkholderiaceae bacterium]
MHIGLRLPAAEAARALKALGLTKPAALHEAAAHGQPARPSAMPSSMALHRHWPGCDRASTIRGSTGSARARTAPACWCASGVSWVQRQTLASCPDLP